MKWYLWHLESIVDFIEKFKKIVIDMEFTDPKTKQITSKPSVSIYCWTPRYQEYWTILRDLVAMCDMLGIEFLEERKKIMTDRIASLNLPTCITDRSLFETDVNLIEDQFKMVESEIKTKLSILDDEEKNRINEALNCYFQGCNYSAVAMSVSAIESRLFSLMLSKCSEPKLEKLTLGQLINEYLENKDKYDNVIPKKHESLLEYCNVYRVFSVHPKREKITKSIATSIINMTFGFLLDANLKHKTKSNNRE